MFTRVCRIQQKRRKQSAFARVNRNQLQRYKHLQIHFHQLCLHHKRRSSYKQINTWKILQLQSIVRGISTSQEVKVCQASLQNRPIWILRIPPCYTTCLNLSNLALTTAVQLVGMQFMSLVVSCALRLKDLTLAIS